jgi:hypothetical protein
MQCRKPYVSSVFCQNFRLMKQWKKLFKETAHAMLLELKSSAFVLQSQIFLVALGEILNLWKRSVQRYALPCYQISCFTCTFWAFTTVPVDWETSIVIIEGRRCGAVDIIAYISLIIKVCSIEAMVIKMFTVNTFLWLIAGLFYKIKMENRKNA